jgi:hypothetical protein
MIWARVDQDNYIQELIDFDPEGKFHSDLIWRVLPTGAERFVNGVFKLTADNTLEAPNEVFVNTLKRSVAGIRWGKEITGVTLTSGFVVWSSRDSQSSANTIKSLFDTDTISSINWKGKDGWRVLNKTEFNEMHSAIALHIKKCFEAEVAVSQLIDNITTVQGFIDFNAYEQYENTFNNL